MCIVHVHCTYCTCQMWGHSFNKPRTLYKYIIHKQTHLLTITYNVYTCMCRSHMLITLELKLNVHAYMCTWHVYMYTRVLIEAVFSTPLWLSIHVYNVQYVLLFNLHDHYSQCGLRMIFNARVHVFCGRSYVHSATLLTIFLSDLIILGLSLGPPISAALSNLLLLFQVALLFHHPGPGSTVASDWLTSTSCPSRLAVGAKAESIQL